MSKKKVVNSLIDQLNLIIEGKEVVEVIAYDVDEALMVHLPSKVKAKLVEAIRLSPHKAERLVKIANMVDAKQLEYTIEKNLY